MAMQIRPDYVNPLTMMADKKTAQKLGWPAVQKGGAADKVTELQTRQQQLQNQMLLLKATGTDSAGATAETQKVVEAELEKVAAELRTAKGSGTQAVEQTEQTRLNAQPTTVRRNMDLYESEKGRTVSPGIYRLEEDGEQGHKISFSPYSED